MANDEIVNNDDNILKVLLATDNHLGCHEKLGKRGEDSFVTFEEILQLGVEHEVDFILLAGDLFHENKPSRNSVVKCLKLLRQYCLGDRPVKFEVVSDQSENFPNLRDPKVNFEDENMNISLPIFSIHGNHDDITGLGETAALDVLSEAGLVNYFGRWTDHSQITITPVLIEKGTTKLAMFGLGNIRDERLYRIYSDQKVEMRRLVDQNSWFNMFILHQNRVKHGPKSYVPEAFLDDWLDLVVWGHEHENRLGPETTSKGTFITQPGSSVATSLCEAEACLKGVGLLQIKGKEWKLEQIRLKTVRPFIYQTMCINATDVNLDLEGDLLREEIENYVTDYMERMISKAGELETGHPKQPKLPLIRLRVEYTDESQMFHAIRMGQKFCERIANPEDAVMLKRKVKHVETLNVDEDAIEDAVRQSKMIHQQVENAVEHYFDEADDDPSKCMFVLKQNLMCAAVKNFVMKGNHHIFDSVIEEMRKNAVRKLSDAGGLLDVNENSVKDELLKIKREAKAKGEVDDDQVQQIISHNIPRAGDGDNIMSDDDDADDPDTSMASSRFGGTAANSRVQSKLKWPPNSRQSTAGGSNSCKCKSGCSTKRCQCFKDGNFCGSRCHPSSGACKNK